MFFPWVGLLEQIRLADFFVFYDDVQFSRGFFNRVQIKTPTGTKWMTVPLSKWHRGQSINKIFIDNTQDWKNKHRKMLYHSYCKAPFYDEMMDIVESVFDKDIRTIAELSITSCLMVADYFEIGTCSHFLKSSELGIQGQSTSRLLGITRELGGSVYLTGHGARNYLDHELFERDGIHVAYMKYQCAPYPQMHGRFTPYVTSLDLVANVGRNGVRFMQSGTVDWREFISECD